MEPREFYDLNHPFELQAREHYGKDYVLGPTREQIEGFYDALKHSSIFRPQDLLGELIVDLSGGNLAVDLELVRLLERDIKQVVGEKTVRPVQYYVKDIAYFDSQQGAQGEWTPLGKRIQEVVDSFRSQWVNFNKLLHKDASELTTEDLGGRKAKIIIDRLGAFWYGYNRGIDYIARLLDNLSGILSDDGAIIIDDYPLIFEETKRNRGDPLLSTGQKLRTFFNTEEEFQNFFKDHGYSLESVVDFTPEGAEKKNTRLLVLKRL